MNKTLFVAQSKLEQAILQIPTETARKLVREAHILLLEELTAKLDPTVHMEYFDWNEVPMFLKTRVHDISIIAITSGYPQPGIVIFYTKK